MLNFIAQQAWKCSVVRSSLVLRLMSTSRKILVEDQQMKSTQREKLTLHYLRSWNSVINYHYKDMISHSEVHTFIRDFPKIKTVLKTELDKTLTVLKSEGYSWDEIQEYKEILLLNSKDLRDRLGVLHDFLIQTPTLHQVVYVSEIMHCSVNVLKDYNVYNPSLNIVKHLMRAKDFQLTKSVYDHFIEQYQYDESVSLKDLYMFLLKNYIALRFSKPVHEVELLFEKDWLPKWKRLSAYIWICNVIINMLQLDFSTVLDNKTLLDLDPVKVTELLDKHPYIGTSSVKDIIVNFPSFLSIPITNIDIWNNMLKKYGVTAFKFNKEALVFFKSHAFKDVEERLNVLVRLPEWQGVERKTSVRQTLISQELSAYVAQELNIQQEEARELLHKDLKTKFGVNNIKRVLNLLFDFGFTREQVINGTIVLNFEHSIVEQGLREFPSRPETQPFDEWMENPLVLHLLAYCIKKDVPHLDVSIKR
ncbi:uncharacterized protein [Cherax quadricarinatus]|uniref:uncharacterized protein isoform X2 n=1 Tax=Cherax quadricarinatus TaxID=27406 RepID=UPI00387EC415